MNVQQLRFYKRLVAVAARQRREVPNFTFCGGREHKTTKTSRRQGTNSKLEEETT